MRMPTGPEIILTLKVLVAAVTVLFAASLWAIATGRNRLHGRINIVFFFLTLATVFGFEVLLRFFVDVTAQFSEEARSALRTHLYFSVPSTILLPIMLFTGLKRRRTVHIAFGSVFLIFWTGTFVTGLFFLPHN